MNKKLTIVMYHYVRDLQNSDYPEIKGLDVRFFEEQLQYIKENFSVIRMEDLLRAYKKEDFSGLPEKGLLLTFDDGYIDHYEVVYPLLKKYDMQGSFFPNAKAVKEHKVLDVNKIHHILATAPIEQLVKDCMSALDKYREAGVPLLSNEKIYDELAIAGRWDSADVIFVKRLLQNYLPEDVRGEISTALFEKQVGMKEEEFAQKLYMNKEQIWEMKNGGMFFGIHGYDHYWLGKLSPEQMKKDVDKALDFFEDVIDRENWVMNYPYGNYNDEIIKFISKKGCTLALSVEPKYAILGEDNKFALPRWDTNDLPPKGKLPI